ncbi:heterokaryon incompatibility protein-domain-containing protein [Nemania serpens]|nr:heterokaryon incompatibility protein-domain-containing protein [Nemania serpens]
MWLLNACTWELKEFITDKQAPPYAILSHTWRDGEVMFREWQKEPWEIVERKEGFAKINSCCQQAVADGLEWVWVDTCCIDKRSSAELSEAINSMYQWYKSAEVCYAYIDDVSDHIESNLANCRWVTRGWTLQELIAPREVVFYSKDWRFLSTRSELSANLAAVTGVQKRFLVGRSLSSASIAQRMSWAAKRTATREEDSAYCLLGIFDVNMPLLYGEGSKAFGRLQEILVREYPYDHSLFAWGKIVGQPSNLVDREPWPTYNPDEVAKPFYGLLANSPADFRDCGKIVRDTTADNLWRPAAVSTLVGSIAHVELPTVTTRYKMALHYQNAPIGEWV